MTELHKINVHLSEGQKKKLAKAYRDNEEVSIRISHSALSGNDTLMIPITPLRDSQKIKIEVWEQW